MFTSDNYSHAMTFSESFPHLLIACAVFAVSYSLSLFFVSRYLKLKNKSTRVSYTSKDIKIAAYHETGHALLYLSMKNIPDDFSCLINFEREGQTYLGETSRFRSSDTILSHKEIWNDMLMLLGGPICEEYFTGEKTIGNTSDIASWQHLARTYLTSSQNHVYYANPTTELEQKTNNKSLKKLLNVQLDFLKKIIAQNEELAKTLANSLINTGKIEKSTMIKMKDKFIFQNQ